MQIGVFTMSHRVPDHRSGQQLLAVTLTWIPIANRYLEADEDADMTEAHAS